MKGQVLQTFPTAVTGGITFLNFKNCYRIIKITYMKWDSKSTKFKTFDVSEVDQLITQEGYFVYILINKDDEVIYVGQSRGIFNRIKSHAYEKEFTKFCLKQISGKNNFIEAYLIFRFQPKYNKSVPMNERFLCIGHLEIDSHSLNGKKFEVRVVGKSIYFDTKDFDFVKSNKYKRPWMKKEKAPYQKSTIKELEEQEYYRIQVLNNFKII